MSLWQIATRNIWQNRGRYLAYVASSAFSVMIYFMYSALIYHPDLQSGYRGASYATQGMQAAAVVIAIFTFLFLLYSNSAFVHSRMKEFGLLTLLGVSRRQLIGIILFESLMIAVVAVAGGLGFGLLFLKLFFMAVSALLRLPEQIPFYAGLKVWVHTLTVFGSFFLLVSLASLWSVVRKNIIEMVRAGRQPKGAPTFSKWKVSLGLVLVLGGYAWASFPNAAMVVLGIVPVTVIVSLGTYLLMREGSIAFLHWLHRRERFFYRPGPFLNVSQLVYKMQENYRVLSAVGILIAVILTAVGTVFTLYVMASADAVGLYPHAFQLVQKGGADPAAEVANVSAVLKKHGVTGMEHQVLVTRSALVEQREQEVLLVPYSFYAAVDRPDGETVALSGESDAISINPVTIPKPFRVENEPSEDRLLLGEQAMPLVLVNDMSGRVLNTGDGLTRTLVLPDKTFAAIMEATPAEQQMHIAIWSGGNWRSRGAQQVWAELHDRYPAESGAMLSMTVEAYIASISTVGMVLFIGVFVSLVFFAACFSLLYFRLFTEIDEDRKYFRRLQQLGVSSRELKRLVRRQAGVIFFVPFLVGLLHSTFAMKALGTLTVRTVLQYGWAVALGYLVLYGLAFGGTSTFYWRSLQVGLAGKPELPGS